MKGIDRMMKKIATADSDDAPAILELQKLAYQSEAQLYNDWNIPPLTQTLDELISDFTTKIFLKAQIGDKIVGSVRGHQLEDTCYIERLIVHPDVRGQGIGTALMAQIESCFDSLSERLLLRQRLCLTAGYRQRQRQRVRRFELFTGHKSDRNIHLYERLGYQLFKSEKITETLSFVFMEKHK
jgi:ribosomal protein S18 acetylase RimI-like enzyme